MKPTTVHGLKCLVLFAAIAVISGAPQVFPALQPYAHMLSLLAAGLGAMVNPQVKS